MYLARSADVSAAWLAIHCYGESRAADRRATLCAGFVRSSVKRERLMKMQDSDTVSSLWTRQCRAALLLASSLRSVYARRISSGRREGSLFFPHPRG